MSGGVPVDYFLAIISNGVAMVSFLLVEECVL